MVSRFRNGTILGSTTGGKKRLSGRYNCSDEMCGTLTYIYLESKAELHEPKKKNLVVKNYGPVLLLTVMFFLVLSFLLLTTTKIFVSLTGVCVSVLLLLMMMVVDAYLLPCEMGLMADNSKILGRLNA